MDLMKSTCLEWRETSNYKRGKDVVRFGNFLNDFDLLKLKM